MSRCRTLPFHPLRDGDDGGDRVRHGRDHARHDDAHRVHAPTAVISIFPLYPAE